jgi:dipeptidase E
MKFYLSSKGVGNDYEKLKKIENKECCLIANAMDKNPFQKAVIDRESEVLKHLGFSVTVIDLKDYFNKKLNLSSYGLLWVTGGNVFILNMVMQKANFKRSLEDGFKNGLVYGGYSAGIVVLGNTFEGLDLVDDIEFAKSLYPGLALRPIFDYFNYVIIPHFESDHHESNDIDKVVDYLKKKNIKHKAISDGDVIII